VNVTTNHHVAGQAKEQAWPTEFQQGPLSGEQDRGEFECVDTSDHEAPPTRGEQHEALAVFLGRWRAEGTSYGSPQQSKDDPKRGGELWISTHTGTWHTGKFFLIQDERARVGGHPFDTLSVMGVDLQTRRYFARSFENHGFYRHYELAVNGQVMEVQRRA
jgi:hypothetical protein